MQKFILLSFSLLLYQIGFAQQNSKKPLDHSVYDQWQSVASPKISNNGKYILYQVRPQQGDAHLYIKTANNKILQTVSRGDSALFTSDSKYAIFTIKPWYKDTREAKIKKKKPEEMPKDSIGIFTLETGKLQKYPDAKSFKLAEKGAFLAFLATKTPLKDTLKKPAADTVKKISDQLLESKKAGAVLKIVHLKDGSIKEIEHVTDYEISKQGNQIAYVIAAPKNNKQVKSGLYIYDVLAGKSKLISSGKGTYKSLVFDEQAKQFAFVAEKYPEKALSKPFSLYYYDFVSDTAQILMANNAKQLKENWSPSGFSRLRFDKNGAKLYFGTAPNPIPQDTTQVDFETAKLDIWHYQDDYLQPMQLKNLRRDLQKNYLAVIYPQQKDKKFIQLEDEYLSDSYVAQLNHAEYILAVTDTGKRVSMQWKGNTLKHAYLISTITGERIAINSKAAKGRFQLSPAGKYVIWYDYEQKNWFSFATATRKTVNLTGKITVSFSDEENDSPDDPQPYGIAAWTENDEAVLIYDRYDIWKINPATAESQNFTNNLGRSTKTTIRYNIPVDKQYFIGAKEDLWLIAQNTINKQWAYYKKNISSLKNPIQLPFVPMGYSEAIKAKDADVYIYTKSNVAKPADLYSSTDFRKEVQLSNINPQQKEYNWFSSELVNWKTPKGYEATGILYKPENFDPTKKYPMVVYFYEKLSDGLYRYQAPAPTPSRLDIAMFASNGYLVFTPDISYTIGEPGASAVEFINSGVDHLKKNSWVNGSKIGIQGQSWGGYQVAYLITHNNMYAAAWSGAPVVNMTSAYGGIRWESGMSRQFQYEHTQSRIGGTLWEKPELYIKNSPLFHLPKVETPVVIMANDADGAVPWYQGIEMFTALRRLGKPVWMLQYNGEAHNLIKRENRKDISIRELQFFDHYLKDSPAPVWMAKGVPAVEKGRNFGLELVK